MALSFGESLRRDRDRIISEWEEAIAAGASRSPTQIALQGSILRNELPELLDALGSWLESGEDADTGMALRLPASHALQRVEQAYQLHQLIEELHLLRKLILSWLLEYKTSEGESNRVIVLAKLNLGLDRVVTDAVEAFVAEREKIRERFVSVLSHDLRTPLGVILSSADSMFRSGTLAAPFYPVVGRIARNAEQMNRMIHDLLDLSRGRLGGGLSAHRSRVQMGDLCRVAIDDLQLAHPDRVITLTTEGDLWGDWDSDRVLQAIGNLTNNAVKYGRDSVSISARDEDEAVLVAVHNDGPPIPQERIPKLFEPFKSAPEHSGRRGGLGLGLYIVSEIMRAHGGTVEVESSGESGTTFTLRWPRSDDAPA